MTRRSHYCSDCGRSVGHAPECPTAEPSDARGDHEFTVEEIVAWVLAKRREEERADESPGRVE